MYTSKDLSENMLSKAKEKAEKAGFHNVTFAIGDAEDTKEPVEQYGPCRIRKKQSRNGSVY